jgi:hypothetical protein
MPDIAISMNAITAMTLARMESADMTGALKRWRQAPQNNEDCRQSPMRREYSANRTPQVASDC